MSAQTGANGNLDGLPELSQVEEHHEGNTTLLQSLPSRALALVSSFLSEEQPSVQLLSLSHSFRSRLLEPKQTVAVRIREWDRNCAKTVGSLLGRLQPLSKPGYHLHLKKAEQGNTKEDEAMRQIWLSFCLRTDSNLIGNLLKALPAPWVEVTHLSLTGWKDPDLCGIHSLFPNLTQMELTGCTYIRLHHWKDLAQCSSFTSLSFLQARPDHSLPHLLATLPHLHQLTLLASAFSYGMLNPFQSSHPGSLGSLTQLRRLDCLGRGAVENGLALAGQMPELTYLALREHLPDSEPRRWMEVKAPSSLRLQRMLQACWALSSLSLFPAPLDDATLDVLLTHGHCISYLEMGGVKLEHNHASKGRRCPWREASILRSSLDSLARLPLSLLQVPLVFCTSLSYPSSAALPQLLSSLSGAVDNVASHWERVEAEGVADLLLGGIEDEGWESCSSSDGDEYEVEQVDQHIHWDLYMAEGLRERYAHRWDQIKNYWLNPINHPCSRAPGPTPGGAAPLWSTVFQGEDGPSSPSRTGRGPWEHIEEAGAQISAPGKVCLGTSAALVTQPGGTRAAPHLLLYLAVAAAMQISSPPFGNQY